MAGIQKPNADQILAEGIDARLNQTTRDFAALSLVSTYSRAVEDAMENADDRYEEPQYDPAQQVETGMMYEEMWAQEMDQRSEREKAADVRTKARHQQIADMVYGEAQTVARAQAQVLAMFPDAELANIRIRGRGWS